MIDKKYIKYKNKDTKKKVKKHGIKWHKDRAWIAFSKFIRLRDCLITMGSKEQGKCVTCETVKSFKEGQAGHFLAGRGNSILFEETNCHFQCYRCNVMNHGEQFIYGKKMLKMYGQKEIDRLEFLKGQAKNFTEEELIEIKDNYEIEYLFMLEGN